MVVETPARVGSGIRWLAVIVLAFAPVLAIYLSYTAWRARLPDPLPSHWNRHGEVDGTTALATLLTIMIVAAFAGGLVALAGAVLAALSWRVRRVLACTGAGIGAFAAALWLTITLLALDRPAAAGVPTPTWHIVAQLAGAGAWLLLVFVVCGAAPAHRGAAGRPATDLPRVDLPSGQRAAWSEVSFPGPVAYALVAGLLGLAVALGVWATPWAATPVVLSAGLTLFLFTIRLVVDRRGVLVGFGPWGWPRVRVPLHEIESAEQTTVRPSDWGGWGYRVRPQGRAVVLRRGPGVRLSLSESRTFVTSTRDPATVAGLVNTLLDRQLR